MKICKPILTKKIGNHEVELMKDCFGVYLCRLWIGFYYKEAQSRNKYTAYRMALAQWIYKGIGNLM